MTEVKTFSRQELITGLQVMIRHPNVIQGDQIVSGRVKTAAELDGFVQKFTKWTDQALMVYYAYCEMIISSDDPSQCFNTPANTQEAKAASEQFTITAKAALTDRSINAAEGVRRFCDALMGRATTEVSAETNGQHS